MEVSIVHSTWLKAKPIQSSELWEKDKSWVKEGDKLKVAQALPGAKQHTKLILEETTLAENRKTSLKEAFVYTPHIKYPLGERFLKLDVPYFSQVDNSTYHFGPGSRQCNLTSCAMLLAALKPRLAKEVRLNNYIEFESFYGNVLAKYGDTTDHSAQTKALRELGVETYFSYTLSHSDLIMSLKAGYPVVLGVAYRSSGHMVIATGFDLDKEQVYIHDPYGIRYGASNSYEIGANAAYDPYSFATLEKIWLDMGSEAGWGRIPISIDGKSTGLPYGL